jgi:hypothetical protein
MRRDFAARRVSGESFKKFQTRKVTRKVAILERENVRLKRRQ